MTSSYNADVIYVVSYDTFANGNEARPNTAVEGGNGPTVAKIPAHL